MNKRSAFNDWFKRKIKVPRLNVSLYMRKLLLSAYFDGYNRALKSEEEIKKKYRAGYDAGYRAGLQRGINVGR